MAGVHWPTAEVHKSNTARAYAGAGMLLGGSLYAALRKVLFQLTGPGLHSQVRPTNEQGQKVPLSCYSSYVCQPYCHPMLLCACRGMNTTFVKLPGLPSLPKMWRTAFCLE